MSFIDEYLPEAVPGYPCISSPRTKTSIKVTAGGRENRNREWEHPLMRFNLPEAPGRNFEVINALQKHWRVMGGPLHSFPFTDPLDKASIDLSVANEPDAAVLARISHTDQVIGTGDGVTREFQLVKSYTVGTSSYSRQINLPVVDSVLIGVDGDLVADTEYTVTRQGGVVTFDSPPANGLAVTAGFLFDVEVRFEDDDVFEGIVRTYQVGGFAALDLVEVRPC